MQSNVSHSRTTLPFTDHADLFPQPANFCPCHVETCFRPTRRLLSLFLSAALGMIEETSLSLCLSYTCLSIVR